MSKPSSAMLYKRLLRYVRPYWRVLLVSVCAMVLLAALEPLLPALMQPLVDESLIEKDVNALWSVPLLIFIVFLAKGVVDYVSNVSTQWIAQRVVADIREELFTHQLCLPVAEQWRVGVGTQISKITYDTQQVAAAVSTAWLTVFRDSLILLALLGYLFFLEWRLTLVILILAPLVAWLILEAAKRLKRSNRLLQLAMGRLNATLHQSYRGVAEIKLFGAERLFGRKFEEVSREVRAESMKAIRIQALNVPVVQIFAALAVSITLLLASYLSAENELSPGQFVSFVAALAMIFEPVRRLTNVNAVIQRGLAAAESIFAVLDRPVEAFRANESTPRSSFELSSIAGIGTPWLIDSNRLSYSYPGESRAAIANVSIRVARGEALALVGTSGSGKTTLAQLFSGLHRDYSGSLLLQGVEASQLTVDEHRSLFSVVSQSPVIFDGSIADNIVLAEKYCESRIFSSIELAGLKNYLDSQHDGVSTLLGAGGIGLSGGQIQRLGLARALYRESECIVLDEATSALDPENQELVWGLLRQIKGTRTIILVTHDPNKLDWVDRIVVLGDGTVVEEGSFAELSSTNGEFARMRKRGASVGEEDR